MTTHSRPRAPRRAPLARATVMLAIVTLTACTSGSGAPVSSAPPTPTPEPDASSAPASAAAGVESQPGGSMSVQRASHTATLLQSGQVLFAGGCVEDSCEGITESTELFTREQGATTPGPSMLEPRVGHTAVALADGRVLVLGGFGRSGVSATTELFDPRRGAFAAGPRMSSPRSDAVAARLPDGTVLVVGGFDGRSALATAELFDPATGLFRAVEPMAEVRSGAAGVLLADGRVLVVGGRDGGRGVVRATAEIYDPATGAWTRTGDLSTRRHKHAVVALADGRALIVAGSDERDGRGVYDSTELFDQRTGTFSAGPALAEGRYKIVSAVVRLADGRVLVAGGGRRAELLDARAERFVPVGDDLGGSWSFATATVMSDGAVLVAGGYDARIQLTDGMVVYRPTTPGA